MERLSCLHLFNWILAIIFVQVQCANVSGPFWKIRGPRITGSWCQYRDLQFKYDKDVFRLQSSYGCYKYTQPQRLISGLQYNATALQAVNGDYYQGILVNGTAYDVDYTNSSSVNIVRTSIRPEYMSKWFECCQSAELCCDRMLATPNQHPGEECPATWDGWDCWQETPSQQVGSNVCPAYIFTGSTPSCNHYSRRYCLNDGEWNQTTNYLPCNLAIRLIKRIRYHVTLLSLSLVVMFPAIITFFVYRKLRRSMRVILIRNLLIAISIRNIFNIISKQVIILNALTAKESEISIMQENGVWCKIVSVCEKLAGNFVFTSMLLLGIFLHRLIAAAFRGEPNMFWYFIAGSVTTCLPVIVLTIVTATTNDTNCWTVSQNNTQWINDSFRVAMLGINVVLMLDIARVLFTKLRGVTGGNSLKIRRTIKATVLLVPVFGIQFIFTATRPSTTDCTSEQIFYYFNYTFDGLQGAIVGLLFCYFNKEVQILVVKTARSKWDWIRTFFDPNYRPKPRKVTVSTVIEPNVVGQNVPPSPLLDTRCFHQPIGNELPEFYTPRQSMVSATQFYTPDNSLAGSPTEENQQFFYTPKNSVTSFEDGGFFECFDNGRVNGGFQFSKEVEGRESDTYA